MFRKLVLAATFAAIALPAAAHTEVKVNLVGLDAKSAHAAALPQFPNLGARGL